MNRRNFIGTLLAASAGFTILPSAGRIWKAVAKVDSAYLLEDMCVTLESQINPEWVNAPYEMLLSCQSGLFHVSLRISDEQVREIPPFFTVHR